jgi:hypothetical protein
MKLTRSLACANTLIGVGALVPAVVLGAAPPLADGQGHFYPLAVGLLIVAPVAALAGTAWSGWLALREPRRRGFWSRMLFTLGIALCLVELFAVLYLPLQGV